MFVHSPGVLLSHSSVPKFAVTWMGTQHAPGTNSKLTIWEGSWDPGQSVLRPKSSGEVQGERAAGFWPGVHTSPQHGRSALGQSSVVSELVCWGLSAAPSFALSLSTPLNLEGSVSGDWSVLILSSRRTPRGRGLQVAHGLLGRAGVRPRHLCQ